MKLEMDINQIIKQHAVWLETNGTEGSHANLGGADLSGADLSGADLTGAYLTGANLTGANLSDADLSGADLTYTNLSDADLYGANLTRADLSSANLSSANLSSANLSSANLSSANLGGANLGGAIGNLNELKSIFCETYVVTYTAEVMQIGCERHKIEDWWAFGDARIVEMDGKTALKWWKTWKPILQLIIETSPATPAGYVAGNESY